MAPVPAQVYSNDTDNIDPSRPVPELKEFDQEPRRSSGNSGSKNGTDSAGSSLHNLDFNLDDLLFYQLKLNSSFMGKAKWSNDQIWSQGTSNGNQAVNQRLRYRRIISI